MILFETFKGGVSEGEIETDKIYTITKDPLMIENIKDLKIKSGVIYIKKIENVNINIEKNAILHLNNSNKINIIKNDGEVYLYGEGDIEIIENYGRIRSYDDKEIIIYANYGETEIKDEKRAYITPGITSINKIECYMYTDNIAMILINDSICYTDIPNNIIKYENLLEYNIAIIYNSYSNYYYFRLNNNKINKQGFFSILADNLKKSYIINSFASTIKISYYETSNMDLTDYGIEKDYIIIKSYEYGTFELNKFKLTDDIKKFITNDYKIKTINGLTNIENIKSDTMIINKDNNEVILIYNIKIIPKKFLTKMPKNILEKDTKDDIYILYHHPIYIKGKKIIIDIVNIPGAEYLTIDNNPMYILCTEIEEYIETDIGYTKTISINEWERFIQQHDIIHYIL